MKGWRSRHFSFLSGVAGLWASASVGVNDRDDCPHAGVISKSGLTLGDPGVGSSHGIFVPGFPIPLVGLALSTPPAVTVFAMSGMRILCRSRAVDGIVPAPRTERQGFGFVAGVEFMIRGVL